MHVYNTEGDCVIFNRSLVATHDMRENFFFLLIFKFFLRVSTYDVNH